jgi:hypothetical protein
MPKTLHIALLLAGGFAAPPMAADSPLDDAVEVPLRPHPEAERRARLTLHAVAGLDGPTGDQIWILHRQGRYGRWKDCAEALLETESLRFSLGRPDRDTLREPHLMVHELLTWFVPETVIRRLDTGRRTTLRACGMAWDLGWTPSLDSGSASPF